jgi:hypothetical protein
MQHPVARHLLSCVLHVTLSYNFILKLSAFQKSYLKFLPLDVSAMWPSSDVKILLAWKLLCSFGFVLVRFHACAGLFLTDGPLSLCCLCVTTYKRSKSTPVTGRGDL